MTTIKVNVEEVEIKKNDVIDFILPGGYYVTLDGRGVITIEGGKEVSFEYVEIDLKKKLKKAQAKAKDKTNPLAALAW